MPTGTRWVVLDGDSEAFQTTGDWHAASNNSAYLSTLLTTSEVGDSSMRFEFLGTEIVLFGKIFSGRGGSGSVAVSCSVDGTPVEGLDPPDGSDWYKFACAWKGDEKTADGSPHIFFLNATVPELSNTAFSIDSVRYLPAYDSDPVLDEESVVEYKNNDAHIEYSNGWEPIGDDGESALMATQPGASATVLFTGERITWEGWTLADKGLGRSSGIFWLNGSEGITFNIDPPASRLDPTVHGVKLIVLDGLSEGMHNLTVAYSGSSTPLVLDRLLVQGGNFRIEAPSESPQSPVHSGSPSGSVSTGVIAGSIVGGLVLVTLGLVTCIWVVRQRRKREIPLRNPVNVPNILPSPPSSSTTHVATSRTPPSTWALTNNISKTPSNGSSDQKSQNALQGSETAVALGAEPSTIVATPTQLQAQGVTVSQGDFALAGRDVHMHRHYHWGSPLPTEINNQIATIPYDDHAAKSQLLPHREEHHLLDEPHSNRQTTVLGRDGGVLGEKVDLP